MKLAALQIHSPHFFIRHLAARRIFSPVQAASCLQALRGGRSRNQLHDRLVIAQRLAAPIRRDVGDGFARQAAGTTNFRDAAKELAKQANIDLAKYQIDPKKHDDRQDEKEKIKRIHKIAQKFFVEQLAKHPEAKKYLIEQRKLDEKTISDFGI
jgi:hypothetical protein